VNKFLKVRINRRLTEFFQEGYIFSNISYAVVSYLQYIKKLKQAVRIKFKVKLVFIIPHSQGMSFQYLTVAFLKFCFEKMALTAWTIDEVVLSEYDNSVRYSMN
jgi:hypothetical protein